MIARVHTVLGESEPALRHAERCLELTQAHADENEEFDLPFAYEAMARAHALNGNRAESENYIQLARQGGESMVEEEERRVFFGEFDWRQLVRGEVGHGSADSRHSGLQSDRVVRRARTSGAHEESVSKGCANWSVFDNAVWPTSIIGNGPPFGRIIRVS